MKGRKICWKEEMRFGDKKHKYSHEGDNSRYTDLSEEWTEKWTEFGKKGEQYMSESDMTTC